MRIIIIHYYFINANLWQCVAAGAGAGYRTALHGSAAYPEGLRLSGGDMESIRLEQLEQALRQALQLVERDESGSHGELAPDHPAARAAEAAEMMLPEPLTLASLAEAICRKIDTVQVLLERARAHEKLPPDAQLAADEGYMTGADDLTQSPQGS
jgi:hypothetical protein